MVTENIIDFSFGRLLLRSVNQFSLVLQGNHTKSGFTLKNEYDFRVSDLGKDSLKFLWLHLRGK